MFVILTQWKGQGRFCLGGIFSGCFKRSLVPFTYSWSLHLHELNTCPWSHLKTPSCYKSGRDINMQSIAVPPKCFPLYSNQQNVWVSIASETIFPKLYIITFTLRISGLKKKNTENNKKETNCHLGKKELPSWNHPWYYSARLDTQNNDIRKD